MVFFFPLPRLCNFFKALTDYKVNETVLPEKMSVFVLVEMGFFSLFCSLFAEGKIDIQVVSTDVT